MLNYFEIYYVCYPKLRVLRFTRPIFQKIIGAPFFYYNHIDGGSLSFKIFLNWRLLAEHAHFPDTSRQKRDQSPYSQSRGGGVG